MSYLFSCVVVDAEGMTATFRKKSELGMAWLSRAVPDDYELPQWLKERLAALSILPVHPLRGDVEIDGIGHVREFEVSKRRRYTVYVPVEHQDMWRELTCGESLERLHCTPMVISKRGIATTAAVC